MVCWEAAISRSNNIISSPNSPSILKKTARKIGCFPLSSWLSINVPFLLRIIYLQTRQIVQYAVTTNPTRQLVRQQLIEFIWNFEDKRIYLIHDGSGEFCNINYDNFGIEGIKISANAPNMNAFADRFIGSVRKEAFDWFILFNEIQIRNILIEYIGYYNEKRPHQGIAQKVPGGYTPQKQGNIITYPILSGLHHHYERLSA